MKRTRKTKKKPGCGKGSVEERMRTATTRGLKTILKTKIFEFQAIKAHIYAESREEFWRKTFIVKGLWLTEQEIDQAMTNEENHQIFRRALQEGRPGQVEKIKDQMKNLNQEVEKLKVAHEKYKSIIQTDARKVISEKMEDLKKKISLMALSIKAKLKELKKENSENQKKPGCGKASAEERMRTATTGSLKTMLKTKIFEFLALKAQIYEDNTEAFKRKIFIVKGIWLNDQEIDQAMMNEESHQIYRRAIQEGSAGQGSKGGTSSQPAIQALDDMALFDDSRDEFSNNIGYEVGRGVEYSSPSTSYTR